MNRRNAIVALLSIPLGAFTFRDARANPAAPASLKVPLDQWKGLIIEYGGKTVAISSAEIFDALRSVDRKS